MMLWDMDNLLTLPKPLFLHLQNENENLYLLQRMALMMGQLVSVAQCLAKYVFWEAQKSFTNAIAHNCHNTLRKVYWPHFEDQKTGLGSSSNMKEVKSDHFFLTVTLVFVF